MYADILEPARLLSLVNQKTSYDKQCCSHVVAIYQSLVRHFGSFIHEGESFKETKDADKVAHSVAKLLNTRIWIQDVTEDKLLAQMQAISNVFGSFKDVNPLCQISIKLLQEQYVMLVQWATAYFNVAVIDSMDLWPRLWKIKLEDARKLWVLIELCFCCLYGNAVCESFISYLRVVKTDWCNRLNEHNLTDLMRIKVTGSTLPVFRECFGELAVDLWNNDKAHRTTQRKRKQYDARGSASKRTRETEREKFLRDWLKDVGVESEKESEGEENDKEMEANYWRKMNRNRAKKSHQFNLTICRTVTVTVIVKTLSWAE